MKRRDNEDARVWASSIDADTIDIRDRVAIGSQPRTIRARLPVDKLIELRSRAPDRRPVSHHVPVTQPATPRPSATTCERCGGDCVSVLTQVTADGGSRGIAHCTRCPWVERLPTTEWSEE